MSIALMTQTWKTDLPTGCKFVLLALCDNSNDQGECYPSIAMIARKCSMSERAVQGHLSTLEKDGYLARKIRTGQSTLYQIDPRRFCTPAEFSPPQNLHHTPAKSAPPPPQNLHPTPAESAPITISEPSTEPSVNQKQTHVKKPRAVDVVLPDWLPEEKWRAYLDHRKAIKSPMTEQAQRLAIQKLDGMRAQGQNPIAVIEQSILNGWKGLFPLKDDTPQQRQAYPSGRKSVHDLPGREAFAGPAVTDGAGNPKAVPTLTQEELEEFL